jgi:hypothetical protein
MSVSLFRQADREDVLRMRDETFGGLRLSRFLWQPCQQVESLDEDCEKFVFREERARGFESSSANPAMLKVNERLGYKPNGLAEVRLAKLVD